MITAAKQRHGSFRRSLNLPEGTREDRIKVRFEHDVREATVEGAGEVDEQPQKIEIESSTEDSIEGSSDGQGQ